MDKLLFGISGLPNGNGEKFDYSSGIEYLSKIGLDSMELPFVRSVNVTDRNRDAILKAKDKYNIYLSAHGSYFINLNAVEEEKILKSKERIIKGAEALKEVNGKSLVFHPGFYLKSSPLETYNKIKKNLEDLPDLGVKYRLETTGKKTQFGNIDELINLCKDINTCELCIDFSHLHARENGFLKDYDDFAKILYKVGDILGKDALENLHMHISGIEYTLKGEKKHLPLEASDFNYKACLKSLLDFKVKGCIICESPILEKDALLLKNYYNSL